jgi:hypothetical protein
MQIRLAVLDIKKFSNLLPDILIGEEGKRGATGNYNGYI